MRRKMKLGYLRISPGEDTAELQRAALTEAGVDEFFGDELIGSTVFKPGYVEALRRSRRGDTLVVWKLDRLARTISALLGELQLLNNLGLRLVAVADGIDSSKPASIYKITQSFIAFESNVNAERRHYEENGRLSGKSGQQPLISDERWEELRILMGPPMNMSVAEVSQMAGITRQAIYKRLSQGKSTHKDK